MVAFRAREHICETVREVTVPLLWMQHIDHMSIRWPIGKKGEYVASNGDAAWMLVPNANLVVMRRFSPKEDDRRVTAAPYPTVPYQGPCWAWRITRTTSTAWRVTVRR